MILKKWVVTVGSVVLWTGGLGLSNGMAALAAPAEGAAAKQTTISNDVRFSCQVVDGEYTVVYSPEDEPDAAYPWAKPTELGGGWTEDRRCAEISRRLESYRPDGLLELQTGRENGYDTLCVTTERAAGCRIVLTVPPGQDPLVTRDRVFENLVVADSGQSTDAVTTFNGNGDDILGQLGDLFNLGRPTTGRSADPINLRPFLAPSDGGTGTQLNPASRSSNPQFNPDRFR